MPRQPRYVLPGQPQHVTQRGNNRSAIFFADTDKSCYLKYLKEACGKYRCDIHAYVLMSNHIHLLMTPHNMNSISKVLQSVGTRYVQYINCRYERTGTLWEGRYKATLIDSDLYLLACYRYIELNPVRAKLVSHPDDYRWSSYRWHAQGMPDSLVRDHSIFLGLGNGEEERKRNYLGLFASELDEVTLEAIRHATNKGWALGTEEFKTKMEALLQRRVRPLRTLRV